MRLSQVKRRSWKKFARPAADRAVGANCLLDSGALCRKSVMTVARDLLSLRLISPWAL
jgi:hypothetical protein